MPPKGKTPAQAPAPVQDSQVLAPKEATLFKQILKYYEIKQYKKGVKAADQILKTRPNHGETLAMKGLILNYMKKKDEARTLVKKGLELNLRSHVCWHVYGLLYNADRQYNEAIRAYQNALRFDPNNLQILKDLSLLQIQRRMVDGFQETRRKLLLLKTNNRNNWIAFAIGNHLCNNYVKALSILDSYLNTIDYERTYEMSELRLYRNMVIEESGALQAALDDLNDIEPDVLDLLALNSKRAELFLRLGKKAEAQRAYAALVGSHPETVDFHVGLRRALGYEQEDGTVSSAHEAELLELYQGLRRKQPKVTAHFRVPLDFLTGERFRTHIEEYLITNLRKGIPSLFKDLRPLYSVGWRVGVIEELVQSYVANLRQALHFKSDQPKGSEPPSVLVWALTFLANHFDYLGRYAEALSVTEEAIAHTPTNLDAYLLKARIYKHAGDPHSALTEMDRARNLDTADRYLNTKCVRYALRADDVDRANAIVQLFLREGELGGVHDMQYIWFELQAALSYVRTKQWGKALKQYHYIEKHYEDMREDQFDFHTYCLRKMTLRAYVRMIRWEDTLRSHRFFYKAANGLVKLYVKLYDLKQQQLKPEEAEDEGLSAEEKKRLEKQKKRQAAKAAAKEKDQKEKEKEETKKKDTRRGGARDRDGKEDDDPDGEKLAAVEDPLAAATKWARELQLYVPDSLDTHLVSMELYRRKSKPLLVLRSLKKAAALAPEHPQVHFHAIAFWHQVLQGKDSLDKVVLAIIDAERSSTLYGTATSVSALTEINAQFLRKHEASLLHRFAALKAGALLTTSPVNAASLVDIPATTRVAEAIAVIEGLEEIGVEHADLLRAYSQKFPLCVRFWDAERRQQHATKPATTNANAGTDDQTE